ncbi:hypothetical protein [Pseudodesulfovibrio sp.]|uniref:hypothetical protein n=1 Tax=Pseudodesulfovibrio sp. TaxID=2035812 RepID=UPI002616EC69|nr:hypothetical protein [Pseudodesulfovibrio sp.]MDD3312900.1 hypothetical protein [Pseudodesulfovibrio sp.]
MKRLLISGAMAMACLLAVAAGAADMGDTVGQACSACHSTKPICRGIGTRDETAWRILVKRMVAKGAKLSSAQATEAAHYLATAKPDQVPFCR